MYYKLVSLATDAIFKEGLYRNTMWYIDNTCIIMYLDLSNWSKTMKEGFTSVLLFILASTKFAK